MDFPYKTASMVRKEFGALNGGRAVGVWYLANRQGMRAEVLELGGFVHRLVVIGGDLKKHDVVLGAPDLAAYGRGEFLAAALRGCGIGADDGAEAGAARPTGLPPVMRGCEEGRHLVLRPVDADGAGGRDDALDSGGPDGFPGEYREIHVALTEENELVVGVETVAARQVAPCGGACGGKPEGPASCWPRMPGPYFNLAGQTPGNVLDHAVAVDVGVCAGQPDSIGYRKGKVLADDVLLPECLGGAVAGFDLCLPIDGLEARDDGLVHCATVYCGRSRVYMDLSTDAPAVRLTTFQPEGGVPVVGKARVRYGNHSGFMLAPVFLSEVSDRPAEQGERHGRPSLTVAYRFTADYPEGYHTDSACMDRIL